MRQLAIPAIAALVGCGVLIGLAPRVHPARNWGYRFDREQAIALAEAQTVALGVSTQGWSAYVSPDSRTELEYYKYRYPDDPAARHLSPYMANVLLVSPDRKRTVSIHLFPDGRVASWDRRESGAQAWTMKSMKSAVDSAFHVIAGSDADQYHPTTESAATKEGLRFTWERTDVSSEFQPTIDVVVRDGAVVHAETHYTFSKSFDNAYDTRDSSMDWFSLSFGVLYFILGLAAVIFYAIGTIRRRVNQRFAFWVAVVNLVSVSAVFFLGSEFARVRAIRFERSVDEYFSAWTGIAYQFVAAMLLSLAAAGGGLSGSGILREKWWALRLTLSRRAFSKQVGIALSAGVLTAVLLSAIPVLVSWMFPTVLWGPATKAALFSPHPLLESFSYLMHPSALIFFGVMFALVWNGIPTHLWRFAIVIPCAAIYMIGFHDTVHAPAAGVALVGGLMAAVETWLFLSFGVLAVLSAETGLTMLSLAVPVLLQPSPGLQATGWQILGLLTALLGGGLVLALKCPDAVSADEASAEPLNVQSQREELQSEFRVAQRAQREMLPAQPPAISGYSLAASCTPAREVGGDLYDFLPLSEGRLAIAVADVSGKGVPAALYMTLTKGLLAATTQDDLQLASILEQINTHLCTVGQRKTFVTMALGILDPQARSLEYGRAGHNPVVWYRRSAGSTSLLSPKGLGLGITAGRVFGGTLAVEKLDLDSGDTLVFYSDGLTEAMNGNLEQFGEERLISVVKEVGDLPAGPALQGILRGVSQFLDGRPAQDDLTLVVLHVD